jgi:transcription elongation GreA/GreB family factor
MNKEDVHAACVAHLTEKITALQEQLENLRSDASGESKSSAGDKHETARAMAQLEQEQLGRHLKEQEHMLASLLPLAQTEQANTVKAGSLVKTNKGHFYLATALGKLAVQNEPFYVLSSQSPLGKNLMGKKVGEQFTVNTVLYSIELIA